MTDKAVFIELLVSTLLAPDKRSVDQQITELVKQNTRILGEENAPFDWRGSSIKSHNRVSLALGMGYEVATELVAEARRLSKCWRDLQEDHRYLLRFFDELLGPCLTPQDARDALPECLVHLMPDLRGLGRTREEAYTTRSRPDLRFRYMMTLPRLQTYAAMGLLTP